MNKVVNINLGGVQFTMDDIAYDRLSQYLLTLKKHFSASEGCDEIMADIEARLAELFQEHLSGRTIVTVKDVEASINIMGKPEDFGAETIEDNATKQKSGTSGATFKTGKKLYRDDSNKVIGGVCYGIAAYFGIEDPLWVRLAFLAFSFTGFAIPLYIILMIILPKAETSADYLAMKGEPINVSNIAKTIETEIERLSNKISGFDKSPEDKKKAFSGNQTRQAIENGMSAVGEAIQYAIHFFGKIFRPFVFLIGILLTIVLCLIWFALFYGFWNSGPIFNSIFDSRGYSILGLFNGFVLVGVPLISLILVVFQSVRKYKIKPYVWASMWSFWSINLISGIFLGTSVGNSFSTFYDTRQTSSFTSSDTMYINTEDLSFGMDTDMFGMKLNNNSGTLSSENVMLNIEKSDGNSFELIQAKGANGSSEEEANTASKTIQWNYKLSNNKLTLPSSFILPKGQKFRSQKVQLTLKVPVGKYVNLGNTYGVLRDFELDEDKDYPSTYEDNLWQMTNSGFICQNYINEWSYNTDYKVDAFSKVQVEGPVTVIFTQGKTYSVKAIGFKESLEKDIKVVNINNLLMIKYDNDFKYKVKFEITLPSLEKVDFDHIRSAEIKGFTQKDMKIVASNGDFDIDANIEVENLILDIEEANFKLKGSGNNLEILIDNHGSIDAKNYSVKSAVIDNKDDSEVNVNVSDNLEIKGNDDQINVKGSPNIKKKKQEE